MVKLIAENYTSFTYCTKTSVCCVVDYICRALPDVYVNKLFSFVASQLAESAEKGFYVTWNRLLLESHGTRLKQRSLAVLPTVNDLHRSLRAVHDLNKMCASSVIGNVDFVLVRLLEALRVE